MPSPRIRIGKQIEKSTTIGSIVKTGALNEQEYLAPTVIGDVLALDASNVPVWATPADTTNAQVFSKNTGAQTTNNISHLESEDAVRTGAVVIGALTAPTTAQTKLDVTNGDVDIDVTTLTTGAITKAGVLWNHNFGTNNTFNGINAGNKTLTGSKNVGFGNETLFSVTSGINNTAVGSEALKVNTTGNFNVGIGNRALLANTTGSSNTAVGNAALITNISGSDNTATGVSALRFNTGSSNTANGANSLLQNTTGTFNTAIGHSSLLNNTVGTENTAGGYRALIANTTGSNNTANGSNSLILNTTGGDNTAVGVFSLGTNLTGADNTACGIYSLLYNTIGSRNTAIGKGALINNVSGTDNVSSGNFALKYNSIGIQNTAVGTISHTTHTVLVTGATLSALSTTQLTLSAPLVGSTVGDFIEIVLIAPFTSTISGFYSGIYQVISPTVIQSTLSYVVFGLTGTVNSVEARLSSNINNSSALGYDAQPYQSNQVALGDGRVLFSVHGNKIAFDLAAINAGAVGSTLAITGTQTGANAGTVKVVGVGGSSSTGISSTFSGTGIALSFVIPHSLGVIPTAVTAQAASLEAQDIAYIIKTSTDVTVFYNVGPPIGVNNLTIDIILIK